MKNNAFVLFLVMVFVAQCSAAQAAFWDKKQKPAAQGTLQTSPSVSQSPVTQSAVPSQKVAASEEKQLDKKRSQETLEKALQEGKSVGFIDRKPTGGYMTEEDRLKSGDASVRKGEGQALFSDEEIELTPEEEEELKKKAEEIQAQVRAVKMVKASEGVKTVRPMVSGANVAQQAKIANTPSVKNSGGGSNLGTAVSAARAASTGGGYRR